MRKINIILSLMILMINAESQVTQEWLSRFALNASDIATKIVVDAAGYSFTSGANYDYAVVKYNNSGVQQWFAKYGGQGMDVDFGRSLAVDLNGNVYITGSSRSGGLGTEDIATLKYNSTGIQQWVSRYNGPAGMQDIGYSMVVDESGNVYVTGFSVGIGSEFDIVTIKYNNNGDTVWTARYNGPGNSIDQAYSIARDNTGNLFITGASRSDAGSGSEDFVTIKYNSSGIQQWAVRYNGPGNSYDTPDELCLDAAGNVYVVGNSVTSGIYDDYCTIKYNSSGVQQWVARYDGPVTGHEDANSIAVDGAGNVYITGNSPANIGTGGDYCTIKYNSTGVQQWVARYNGPGNAYDNAHVVKADNSGNVYVNGGSNGSGSNFDYFLIKYSPSGDTVWTVRYNGPNNSYDVSYDMVLDPANNIYITGQSSGLGDDFATIKYSQLVGVKTVSNTISSEFMLGQNYPNPFNPSTILKFQIANTISENVKLVVYDILGNEVKTLVDEKLNGGIYEAEFDGNSFASGIYFYKLILGGNLIDTKKMILVK